MVNQRADKDNSSSTLVDNSMVRKDDDVAAQLQQRQKETTTTCSTSVSRLLQPVDDAEDKDKQRQPKVGQSLAGANEVEWRVRMTGGGRVSLSSEEQQQPRRHSGSKLSHQSATIRLDELVTELKQLDLALNRGSLTNDMEHLRSLLLREIQQVHSQLPLQQKRRYASQMPSSMKRVVCIPLINNNALFAVDKCHVGPKGYGNEAKLCLGRPNSSSWAASESPRQKFALVNSSLMTMSHRAAAVDRQHSHRSRHQLLCASIPSLLASSPPAIAANNRRASYYTGDTFNLGPSLGKGSNNCAVDNPTMVSDLDFLGHSGNNYLYRCDFAKHVQYENGQFTMQERIYLPENPGYKIIGRILGPRGNSLRRLEAETGCRIVIRGKGSVKDQQKESRLHGLPGWEHLDEPLHVLVTAQQPGQLACSNQLHHAVQCIKTLLTPRFDAYKREQLLQLAIINGTYQPRP